MSVCSCMVFQSTTTLTKRHEIDRDSHLVLAQTRHHCRLLYNVEDEFQRVAVLSLLDPVTGHSSDSCPVGDIRISNQFLITRALDFAQLRQASY